MKTEDLAERIRRARELIGPAIADSDSPQIESMLRNADMELYLALWHLGEATSVRPELGYAQRG